MTSAIKMYLPGYVVMKKKSLKCAERAHSDRVRMWPEWLRYVADLQRQRPSSCLP